MPSAPAALRLALASILLALVSHTRADPDLWGHVQFGRDTLAKRAVDHTDQYSFLSAPGWINHEWLAEVASAVAFQLAGGTGLVILKLCAIAAMVVAIARVLRRGGMHGRVFDVLVAVALVGVFPQINHVRPQVFSLALFAWLLVALTSTRPDRRLPLVYVPPIFAAWVNLHGGWIVGGGVLVIWTLFTIKRPGAAREVPALLATGLLALAATCINPYGWGMWQFLWRTVGFGRADVVDWQPVYAVGPAYVGIWLMLAVLAALALRRGGAGGERMRHAAVVIALAAASFRVNRLVSFFAIALVVLLGGPIASLFGSRMRSTDAAPARGAALAAVLAIAVIVGALAITVRNATCVAMDAAYIPEPEPAQLARDLSLSGRLLVWFDWGEYAIWHMGPRLQVSIDGRRETVYPDEVIQDHLRFYFVPATRDSFLARVRPDFVWLPLHLPGLEALRAAGWHPLFEGPRSIFLARSGVRPSRGGAPPPPAPAGTRRCFPGP